MNWDKETLVKIVTYAYLHYLNSVYFYFSCSFSFYALSGKLYKNFSAVKYDVNKVMIVVLNCLIKS